MKRLYVIFITLLTTLTTLWAQNNTFINLGIEDVKIDSILPTVAYNLDLPANYSDSVYTLTLKYPEFIDMSDADVEAYKKLDSALPPEMPVVENSIVVSRKKPVLVSTFCPVVYRDGKYQFLVSYKTSFAATATKANSRLKAAANVGERYAKNSVLKSGKWGKIRVSQSGIHQLTADVIRKAGFTDMSKVKIYGYGGNLVPETLTASYLIETDDLKEIPTYSVNGKKLFYAEGPVSWKSNTATDRIRNPYSNYGYYFITEGTTTPKSQTKDEFLEENYPKPCDYHTLYEVDNYSWYDGGRNLVEKSQVTPTTTKSIPLTIPAGVSGTKITTVVSADTKGTSVKIQLNDSLLGSHSISLGTYDKANFSTKVWTPKGVKEQNTIKISTASSAVVRLDYIMATYTTPKGAPDLDEDNFPSAEYVYNITNQNHHADPQCDMVIIIPTSQKLLAQAQRLKEWHESADSMKVNIVPADELYNEFSSGTPDVSAYKRYMKMLYDRAETEADMPKYLLLFGDGLYDNRLLTSNAASYNADDLLLCYESENSQSTLECYVSDDFIGMLDDNEALSSGAAFTGIPDIGVGRIPAVSVADAKAVVDKTLYYAKNSHDGAWQNTIMFLGDDGNSNIHMRDVNEVADVISQAHPEYLAKKVMWDAYTRYSSSTGNRYTDIAALVKKQQNNGALIIDYGGHGSANAISHEYVLTLNDFAAFRGNNYPLWVTASCDIMPFDHLTNSIGETALLNDKGGAVAFYGTSRTVLSNYNKHINRLFLTYVLSNNEDGSMHTIGEAARLTKDSLVRKSLDRTVNKLQYSLLGDPALRLARASLTAVVDSINGEALSDGTMPKMKAGSKVSIKGHIEQNGVKLPKFNGLASIMVRDSKEHIVCKLNDTSSEGATTAFEYDDYGSTLYQGTDSVSNGEFSFTFAMPLDISYSDASGIINLYAHNSAKTLSANGYCEQFIVGGSEIAANDSIGPSVYCYLNQPDFANGGTVNSTPFFVAEVYDEDGINASDSGIGHDLQLVIDGLASKTYSLSDNFTFEFGSFTKGQTYYQIPELEAGTHTLRFRAWDILNNPTTSTLTFVVQKGMTPSISSVYATPNPASDSVTFVVTHDRPGSEINVVIDVMDASGRLLWSTEENSTTSVDKVYQKTWDLTVDSGARLQTGVYLYRVRLKCDGSDYVSNAKKLIVVRRH